MRYESNFYGLDENKECYGLVTKNVKELKAIFYNNHNICVKNLSYRLMNFNGYTWDALDAM